MLHDFVDTVEPMDTLLITAERRYEMKNSSSSRTKPLLRRKLRSPMTTTRDVDPSTDLGIGLVGTMIMGLCCQIPNLTQEENSGQAIRVITT